MITFATLIIKSRLFNQSVLYHYVSHIIVPIAIYINKHYHYLIGNRTMSQALRNELDRKMQQMKEYGLIAHGYYNENVQYPVQVRRSHDGEKVVRSAPVVFSGEHLRPKARPINPTALSTSFDEHRTKTKPNESVSHRPYFYDEQRTFIVPPNKTIDDIDPSFINSERHPPLRKSSSSSSTDSSPSIVHTARPHSIAGLSSTKTDEQPIDSLFNSSQSLLTSTTSSKTLTQRFLWKIFHHQSKS